MGQKQKGILRAFLSVFLCLAISASASHIAHAQSDNNGLPGVRSFFRKIFRPDRKPEVNKPARATKKRVVRQKKRQKVTRAASAAPEPEKIEKLENARKVLFVGDFLAGGVAGGLKDAFDELPGVIVADRSNGSSGFVRDDFYDWPSSISAILEEEKPAILVVMIGSNDRQQMVANGKRLTLRSKEWDAEYSRRINAFTQTIREASIPLLWIGMPPFKRSSMTTDMLAFNDIYKKATIDAGGEFIDIWNGFVDENGAFITTGPDINGQPVRLRSSDGINLTKAGRRKVAFYTEKPLKKLLGNAASPDIGKITPEMLPQLSLQPLTNVPKADRTIPISLDDPAALDGGDELLGLVPEPMKTLDETASNAQRLAIDGIAPQPETGRADNFSEDIPTPEKLNLNSGTTSALPASGRRKIATE